MKKAIFVLLLTFLGVQVSAQKNQSDSSDSSDEIEIKLEDSLTIRYLTKVNEIIFYCLQNKKANANTESKNALGLHSASATVTLNDTNYCYSVLFITDSLGDVHISLALAAIKKNNPTKEIYFLSLRKNKGFLQKSSVSEMGQKTTVLLIPVKGNEENIINSFTYYLKKYCH